MIGFFVASLPFHVKRRLVEALDVMRAGGPSIRASASDREAPAPPC
jgi:hypothetical protein